jgi:hypothetical protein
MNFIHSDLGNLQRGQVVEVTLNGNAANVRLMDSSNFSNYKNGRDHRYYGGLAKKSPVRIPVPSSGHWHVAVDMQGLGGYTKASFRVLPSPLPVYNEPTLSSVPSLLNRDENNDDIFNRDYSVIKKYDVFISHATEDKADIVRPLAHALQNAGLRVWYDEFELKLGDSLRRKIDAGLANSSFGIVVLSHPFFRKNWSQYELDGLVTREMTGEQIILPVWHNISKNEVISYSPSLADKLARSTATHTVEEIAEEIVSLIQSK